MSEMTLPFTASSVATHPECRYRHHPSYVLEPQFPQWLLMYLSPREKHHGHLRVSQTRPHEAVDGMPDQCCKSSAHDCIHQPP